MLWLIWTDSVRPQRGSRIMYALRGMVFLAVSGLLMFRVLEAPQVYTTGAKVLIAFTSAVGLLGAGYFGRKASLRDRPRPN
jgi:hypothetical protein